jgi:membrane-bound serine protease (ClpP class)
MVLSSVQKKEDGFVGVNVKEHEMIGKQGIAFTILRPSGKIEIEGDVYNATALTGYIDKGEAILVVKYETSQLFVRKV